MRSAYLFLFFIAELLHSFLVELGNFVVFTPYLLPSGSLCQYLCRLVLACSTLLSLDLAYLLLGPSQLALNLREAVVVLPGRGNVLLGRDPAMPLLLVRLRAFGVDASLIGIGPSVASLCLSASARASRAELEVLR